MATFQLSSGASLNLEQSQNDVHVLGNGFKYLFFLSPMYFDESAGEVSTDHQRTIPDLRKPGEDYW